ncbi:MAG: hypothetical protein FWF58_04585 [Firmicutes bacterium]|nr:hypothetical protein [Bacillota bacterium]
MAQYKSILDKMSLGDRPQPDFVKVTYQGSRFRFFFETLKLRLGKICGINLLSLLLFLPVAAVIFYFYYTKLGFGVYLPFNSNVGIGYPPSDLNLMEKYHSMVFLADLQQFGLIVPLSMLGFVGLAGAFRATKILSWDKELLTTKEFFWGVKQGFAKFFFYGLLFGIGLFGVYISLSMLQHTNINVFLGVVIFIASILLFIFLASACMFMCTQATLFSIGFWRSVGNGFAMAGVLYWPNLLISILGFGPVVLFMYLSSISPQILNMIFIIPIFLYGITFVILAYTLYSHFIYERFLFKKVSTVQATSTKIETDSDENSENTKEPKIKKSKSKPVKPQKYRKKID